MCALLAAVIATTKKRVKWAVFMWVMFVLIVINIIVGFQPTGDGKMLLRILCEGLPLLFIAVLLKKREAVDAMAEADTDIQETAAEDEGSAAEADAADTEPHAGPDAELDGGTVVLSAFPASCPDCGAALTEGQKFCSSCGRKIEAGKIF